MQDIYTYIPETNYVPREYSVAAILLLLFMVLISLVSVLNLLYIYISTFRSMCAVPIIIIVIIVIPYKSLSYRYNQPYPNQILHGSLRLTAHLPHFGPPYCQM